MSLFDAVTAAWRTAFPKEVVDQFLAEEGPAVRAALEDAEQAVRDRKSRRKLQTWLDGQASTGRDFDEAQLRWLDWMREDIAAHGHLSPEQLGQGRYAEAGGAEKAARLFGRRTLGEVLASLNATLGRSSCGCGGTCGGEGGGGCACARRPATKVATLVHGAAPTTADDSAANDELVERARNGQAWED